MVVLWIIGIILALIVLVLLLRVGVYLRWGEALSVFVRVGPLKCQILPRPEKKEKTPKKPKKAKKENKKPQGSEKKPKKKPDLTWEDIRSAIPALFESLKRGLRKTRRRMRVKPMHLCVIFGHDDPAKTAELYGWASSIMWSVMPELEELIQIPDPQIHLDVDFDARTTYSEGECGILFQIRDFVAIGFAFGIPLLKWFLAFKKSKKSRSKTKKKPEKSVNTEKIASETTTEQ